MIPPTHQGEWAGPSRLWYPDPVVPKRSEGRITAAPTSVTYEWAFEGAAQQGTLDMRGPDGSLRCSWRDTWHAADGMVGHGCWSAGLLRVWSTYDAGDVTWGWRIELDARDPEHLLLRMFNVPSEGPEQIAHDLRAGRVATTA